MRNLRGRARAHTKKVEQLAADAIATAEENYMRNAPTTEETIERFNIPVRIDGPKVSSKNFETAGRERLLPDTSAGRKEFPMCTGLVDYFPDALAAVSQASKMGNDKHNPGEPIHWARDKSMDHPDCIMRHLTERGGFDAGGARHSAQLAWRALALLQEELEAEFGFEPGRGATLPPR